MGSESELVKSDQTMLDVVQALHELDGAGVTEVSEHLGRAKSTVYKHLKTLEEERYVVRNNGKYALGYRFLHHGGWIRDNNRLIAETHPKLRELSEKSGLTVLFTVKEYEYGFYVIRENPTDTKLSPLGTYFHLHTTAAGKGILSLLPDEDIREYIETTGLQAQTSKTIDDEASLFREIRAIRERGYAVNLGERMTLSWGVAVPIRDEASNTLGAISLGFPAESVTESRIHDEFAPQLLEIRGRIKRNLEF